jgi:hypothetical protein
MRNTLDLTIEKFLDPDYPIEEVEYRAIYANFQTQFWEDDDDALDNRKSPVIESISISQCKTIEEVLLLLPDNDGGYRQYIKGRGSFEEESGTECGGSLTRDEIRFVLGDANSVHIPDVAFSKMCFHTHPSDSSACPSIVDLFVFLGCFPIAHVIKNSDYAFYYRKTQKTMNAVNRLFDVACRIQIKEFPVMDYCQGNPGAEYPRELFCEAVFQAMSVPLRIYDNYDVFEMADMLKATLDIECQIFEF